MVNDYFGVKFWEDFLTSRPNIYTVEELYYTELLKETLLAFMRVQCVSDRRPINVYILC
jgi:hypothetical protein